MLQRYGIGTVVLLAWISLIVPSLLIPEDTINEAAHGLQRFAYENKESIGEMNRKNLSGAVVDDVEVRARDELWNERDKNLAISVIGAASGVMAIFAIPFWRLAVVATSLLYLGRWYTGGSMMSVSFLEAYELKWMTAKALGVRASFVQMDIVLPIVYVSVVAIVVVQAVLSYSRSRA